MSVRAQYYDGRQPLAHDVLVTVAGGQLRLVGANIDLKYPLEHIQVQSPLANTPRVVVLPRGDTCVVQERACDELFAGGSVGSRGVESWIDGLERKGSYAVGALAIGALAIFAILRFGIPYVSEKVAQSLSPAMEASLGAQTLAALDRLALSPTRLDSSKRAELTERFAALARASGGGMPLSLAFRQAPEIGPNAFALPGGTIVLLDELVELASNTDEIAAVLCHEIGHVYGRHSTRAAFQNSASVAVLGIVLGDVSSLGTYAAAIPGVLLTSSYSRAFEREADEYGVAVMDQVGIPLESLSAILLRIDAQRGAGQYPNFLSSHPSTAERVHAIRQQSR